MDYKKNINWTLDSDHPDYRHCSALDSLWHLADIHFHQGDDDDNITNDFMKMVKLLNTLKIVKLLKIVNLLE